MKQHLEQRNENTFDGWLTPEWVLDLVRKMGPIGLDPCTEESNPTKAVRGFTSHGLERDWFEWGVDGNIFVNPPYGRALGAWGRKIAEGRPTYGPEVFALVPARPDTGWFGTLWDSAAAVAFFRKRIKFSHPSRPDKQAPMFPNAMFYFGSGSDAFKQVFSGVARVVVL